MNSTADLQDGAVLVYAIGVAMWATVALGWLACRALGRR